MCFEAHISSRSCECTTIHNLACDAHVEHTHNQIDDEPCPFFTLRFVEMKVTECRGTSWSPCHHLNTHTFAHWTDWRHRRSDWDFCEDGIPGVHACVESGVFLESDKHTCGLGLEVKGEWRHLKTSPLKPVVPKADTTVAAPKASTSATTVEAPEASTSASASTSTSAGASASTSAGASARHSAGTSARTTGSISARTSGSSSATYPAGASARTLAKASISTPVCASGSTSQREIKVEEPANDNVNKARVPRVPSVKVEVKFGEEGQGADVDMEDSFEALSLDDTKGKAKEEDKEETDKPALKKVKREEDS